MSVNQKEKDFYCCWYPEDWSEKCCHREILYYNDSDGWDNYRSKKEYRQNSSNLGCKSNSYNDRNSYYDYYDNVKYDEIRYGGFANSNYNKNDQDHNENSKNDKTNLRSCCHCCKCYHEDKKNDKEKDMPCRRRNCCFCNLFRIR